MELDGFVSPRPKIQSKIMKTATRFKHKVPKASFPIPNFVFNNAIPFDPTDGMFDPNSYRRQPVVNALVQVRKRFASGFLFGLKNGHIFEREALKPSILE